MGDTIVSIGGKHSSFYEPTRAPPIVIAKYLLLNKSLTLYIIYNYVFESLKSSKFND